MMMRLVSLLAFTVITGCAASATEPEIEAPPPTVREALADHTRLFATTGTAGAITAKRWSRDGWIGGDAPIVIDGGGVAASLDASGRVVLDHLQLQLQSIAIPEDALGTPITLDGLRLDLVAAPPAAETAWITDDAATAKTTVELALAWSITVGDVTTALGPLKLPPLVAHLTLGGDGGAVELALDLDAEGVIWSWFGIIEIADLHLAVRFTDS